MLDSWWQDFRYAARALRRSPGFTIVAVTTLALGIGANTAIFSVVNALLLRPLPFRNDAELVQLWSRGERGGHYSVSGPNFADWRGQSRLLQDAAALSLLNANLTGAGEPQRVAYGAVTANFFAVLGVTPALGRAFAPDEPVRSTPVAVLGDGLWRRRFGADSGMVGRTVQLNGTAVTVIGVLPRDFHLGHAELWVPFRPPTDEEARGHHYLEVIGRLRPGVGPAQLQAEMEAVGRRLEEERSNGATALVVPLRDQLAGAAKRPTLFLLAAAGFVLLIACVNVANLVLVRSATRRSEFAIRNALGAGRARVVRLLLVESTLLALVGGAVGFGIAALGTPTLLATGAVALPPTLAASFDARVWAFAFGAAAFTAAVCALVPALDRTLSDAEALRGGSRGMVGGVGVRARAGLVVVQVALAVLPLLGAGLLTKSFFALRGVDPGFRAGDDVLTAALTLPRLTYRDDASQVVFYRALLARLGAMPGVARVGLVSHLPLGGDDARGSFVIVGSTVATHENPGWARIRAASAGYFEAMGTRLVRGRTFQEADDARAPFVVVIDTLAATEFFSGEDPIGRRLITGFRPGVEWEVVGIVGAMRHGAVAEAATPHLYFPVTQQPLSFMTLVVRGQGRATGLAPALRAAVRSIDPTLPLYDVRTMADRVARSIALPRFDALLFSAFGLLALLLASLGVYGVIAYNVAQRTREIGIRIALGARAGEVASRVLWDGARLATAGVAIGVVGGLALARLMRGLLYGTAPADPLTFAFVSLVLAGIALLASWLPARRAARLDPMEALRHE